MQSALEEVCLTSLHNIEDHMTAKQYLRDIGDKVEFYYNARCRAIDYITRHKLQNPGLQTNIVLISAIWAASQFEKEITNDELEVIFGLYPKTNEAKFDVYGLSPDHKELTLGELFDITVENF